MLEAIELRLHQKQKIIFFLRYHSKVPKGFPLETIHQKLNICQFLVPKVQTCEKRMCQCKKYPDSFLEALFLGGLSPKDPYINDFFQIFRILTYRKLGLNDACRVKRRILDYACLNAIIASSREKV